MDRGGWHHSLYGCRGANGPASSWLHWCTTAIALLHLGLEAAHGGRRSSVTANSSWNPDYVCPLASENIKYSDTISLATNQYIFFFCFMCPYSIMYELFMCPFSFAFNFKVDGFIFCLLSFSAVFCLCQLYVSDTSYPLFSNGVNQGNGDEPVSPQWKEVTVCNTAQLCISCTLHTNTFGSLTCSERVCVCAQDGLRVVL